MTYSKYLLILFPTIIVLNSRVNFLINFYSAKSSDIIKARRQTLPVGVPLPAALLDNKKS